MAFRFWRRVKIAPGLTLNLSKSGGSLSFGPRGAKYTLGGRGQRVTAGIPGTGLFYTTTMSGGRGRSKSGRRTARAAPPETPRVSAKDRLTLGFFRRLVTPAGEKALVDGCRELIQDRYGAALEHFRQAGHLPDGAFMAGFLALKAERFDEAVYWLGTARTKHNQLGRYFDKYGVTATFSLPITPEVTAHVRPQLRGVLLALAEAYQLLRRPDDAEACLRALMRSEPGDVVVRLSLAEILLDRGGGSEQACQETVRLTKNIRNETPIHTVLLLYKARALRGLGLHTAARDTLTGALRRTKDRDPEILHAVRYERALVYEDLGHHGRARKDFERLYAEAPGYEDVAERLGLN
jgi:tetratricopeptide (TPR) repeat protein